MKQTWSDFKQTFHTNNHAIKHSSVVQLHCCIDAPVCVICIR